ncbi:TetR family transcriptional regulator [Amycolatopsis jiangsuensis]|uniref:AcrR family transcriptional regulator n=1 Tax=Amycolatopsis jiangsuensis TaxID=1181879 RepID=A0A840IJW8_9PSEU|nr:TetR family transcriptional regulator [Amycolatopsis jiangsuensis]MBB4682601.1 AcrR family transcriptional regulator [Amycolatopsis jiangsuensis]
MARWEPGARDRLRDAALTLFLERGFEQTMVAEIAERAGVTARTFFRHFADKREVLFDGSSGLEETALAAVEEAPASSSAMDAVMTALDAVAAAIGENHDFARKRQTVITANAELRERELIKHASISRILADGLRRRGADAFEAALAAETGVAVYRVAFEQWTGSAEPGALPDVIRASLTRLRALTSAG